MAKDKSTNTFVSNVIWYVVGFIDYLNTTGIYTGYLTEAALAASKSTLQNVFFPIYAANTLVYFALSLNNLLHDRHKKDGTIKAENLVRFIINSLSVLLVCGAVVCTLAFAAYVGVAATYLFALNLALTGVFNFIGAGYHFYQYNKLGKILQDPALTPDAKQHIEEKRSKEVGRSLGYLVVGVTTGMAALAGALALLGGFLPLAAIGVIACVIGISFSVYAYHCELRAKREQIAASINGASQPAPEESSTTVVQKKLSAVATSANISAPDDAKNTTGNLEPATDTHDKPAETPPLLSFTKTDDVKHTPGMAYAL